MKIAALFPVGVDPTLEEFGTALLQGYASPGTEISIFFDSRKTLAYSGEIEQRSVDAVKNAVYAEKNGFDAVIVAALCDFGLMSVRGAVKIPVVGMAMATYLMAYQLASRYACISEGDNWTPVVIKAVREAGCYERMTSVRALPKALRFPLPNDYYTPEEFEAEVKKIAKRQVEDEGAQLLVITFALLSLLMPPGWKERLEKELGIIVLDPMAIAVKTTEMLVNLGLAHSKIEYPQMEV